MSEKDWGFRVEHMLKALTEIERSISDHSSAQSLFDDVESFRAVERNFEIIAEASKHIPDDVKKEFNRIEWRKVVDMRNLVAHNYDGVDHEIIWQTIKLKFPELQTTLKKIMDRYGQDTFQGKIK